VKENLIVISLVGGGFLLLYGIRLAGDGLKGWAGPRIKTGLETMTRNRVYGFLTGVLITFFLQSSSATSVTVVSLIESGLMSFPQSLAIILGSDVGTTITVQLISFKIYDYALLIIGFGIMLTMVATDERRRCAGEAILGFGLIFLAIRLMAETMLPLKDSPLFMELLGTVAKNPMLGIVVAAAFSATVHSSAATIGIAITMSVQGLLDIDAAIPIVIGANIGTTVTAILGSLRGNIDSRRAAFANLMFKVLGAAIFYPLIHPFAHLMSHTADFAPRQIANAHTVFNLIIALCFLPFTGPISRQVERWFPAPTAPEEEEFRPKYLNPTMLATPALALAQATRETMRMAEIVQDMLRLSLPAILDCNLAQIEKIEDMDDHVDILDRAIRFYLTQLSKAQLRSDDAAHQMESLQAVSNLEAIGDVIDKNLMEYARKKAKTCVHFSPGGQQDIAELHARVLENLELAMSAFTTRDPALADRVHRNKRRVRDLEREYYARHIQRLEDGLSEAHETSSIHLDILTNLKRINTHVTNIVYPLLEQKPSGEASLA
jgi:phosphate:Na+ symporter